MKIILAIFLLIIFALGGWYVYKNFLYPEPPKSIDEEVPKKLINAQERIIKLATTSELSKKISASGRLPKGNFEVIFFSEEREGARHFLTPLEFSLASGMHIPQELFSSISNYNFGTIGGNAKNYNFLILDVKSPEAARDGILKWEDNMLKSLKVIFPDLENSSVQGKSVFQDKIIKNQNARILESGNSKIVYSFYNQRLLIIAPSEEIFGAIISRYAIFPPN